ncbi:MAG: methionine--tRNA ligase [Actinobacteria bacterium]|nr:methionine--tRNA ligase [Actinomycetota bacterium]
MKKKTFYVTTPIYYVNDVPHIGHAYCTVIADVIARFKRLCKEEVFFLTGTDEHGQKVEKAAASRNLSPQDHVDKMVVPFKELWQRFDISYDDFIRTTQPRHVKVVQSIFKQLYDQGDIYKGNYEGWYCVHEETFYLESQLADGKCPECGRQVEWIKEESYYFKTSKYQEKLLKHIEDNPDFIKPESRRNEVISFINSGVMDVCVSRTTFKWGIPVPFDTDHIVYVWFDALINYLTGAGFMQDEKFDYRWPADIHLLGKDIIKFHAVIWPSMLYALGIDLPEHIWTTGFWTLGKEKISKSKGLVINPNELADQFGVDAIRYFFLKEIPVGADGEFSHEALIKRVNSDLANDLGNLLHRTIPMIKKYCNGRIPLCNKLEPINEKQSKVFLEIGSLINDLSLKTALETIWSDYVKAANKYIDDSAPWNLAKAGDKEKLDLVMYNLAECIRIIAVLIYPFMPKTAEKIWNQLGITDKIKDQKFPDSCKWGGLKPDTEIVGGEALFPRIEVES